MFLRIILLIVIPAASMAFKFPPTIQPYQKNLTIVLHEKMEFIDTIKELKDEISPMQHVMDDLMDIPSSGLNGNELLEGFLCISFLFRYRRYLKNRNGKRSSSSTPPPPSSSMPTYFFWLSVILNFLRNIHPAE